MDTAQIVRKVDSEKIYQHVLRIEGTKHPIDTPEKLNDTANYIHSEFEKYGLEVNNQEFKIEDYDATFRNIEGVLGDKKSRRITYCVAL
ncbi:MAG: hypothetical protein OEY88_07270 [Candidatus Bathyarchaeota archaeon]|nr:hypothetical protein [Candidatus Bathyarchaeota archaeon]